MKRVLIKLEKSEIVDAKRKVVSSFEKHYVDPSQDFHTKHGRIKKEDLAKKAGSKVPCGSQEFIILDADFIDDYKHIKRHAQIIGLKDVGAIITGTGINKNSKILEAGVGSGALTCYLAMFAKKIVSYDVDDRSLDTARENVKRFGFKNVTIKKGSIYDVASVSEKNFDVLLLDVPEPWSALGTAKKSVKVGGFIAVYVPHVMQVHELVKRLDDCFLVERTIEIIEREWAVDEMRTRPATKDHSHTGFITFLRKLF